MAFIVINVVKASKEELPAILTDVQRLGLAAMRTQPGFPHVEFYEVVAAYD